MPQSQPNQAARVVAVLALIAGFILVIITIVTSEGGGSDGSAGGGEESSGITARGERALEQGVWVVREGDTLAGISQQTGIDQDELIDFNPEIDPQILVTGQRISLRAGVANEQGDEKGLDSDQSPTPSAEEAGGGGVGDDGPTGTTGSGISDGID